LIAPTKKSKELKRLMRDGFARIDHSWGLAPFLTADVRRVISSRLTRVAQGRGRDDVPVSTLELPELKAVLLPALLPRLTELARSYLGEDAELYLNGGTPRATGTTTGVASGSRRGSSSRAWASATTRRRSRWDRTRPSTGRTTRSI
jgi:hypothetical protein